MCLALTSRDAFSREEDGSKLEGVGYSGSFLDTSRPFRHDPSKSCDTFSSAMAADADDDDSTLSLVDLSPPVRVKRGYRNMSSTLTCGVLFESDPVWLWAIRGNSWSAIYLTGPDEATVCQDHPHLFAMLKPNMPQNCCRLTRGWRTWILVSSSTTSSPMKE